jgi:hypothetical protein
MSEFAEHSGQCARARWCAPETPKNAQANRAESARTILVKTAQATRRLTASLRLGAQGVTAKLEACIRQTFPLPLQ